MAPKKTARTEAAPEAAPTPAAPAPAPRPGCECGCGGTPRGRGGRFLPGHDARHHGALQRAAAAGDARAAAELRERSWTPQAPRAARQSAAERTAARAATDPAFAAALLAALREAAVA